MTKFLFAYGSLLSRESASRVLKRDVVPGEFSVASLTGFRRSWTLKERVVADVLGREISAVFLDLEERADSWCNGLLIELSDPAFVNLRAREKNYDAMDVTHAVRMPPAVPLQAESRIYTFVGKPKFRPGPADRDLYVMERYVAMVHAACAELGPGFQREYVASTAPVPYPLLPGAYRFADMHQAQQV